MGRYKLVKDEDANITSIIVNDETHPTLPQGTCIPVCVGNKDYDDYLEWDETNDADDADTIDYMVKMRAERDSRMNAMQWRIQRNQRQVANNETPDDADGKMDDIYDYMKDLANMPENNSSISTKAEYDALTWPTKPE